MLAGARSKCYVTGYWTALMACHSAESLTDDIDTRKIIVSRPSTSPTRRASSLLLLLGCNCKPTTEFLRLLRVWEGSNTPGHIDIHNSINRETWSLTPSCRLWVQMIKQIRYQYLASEGANYFHKKGWPGDILFMICGLVFHAEKVLLSVSRTHKLMNWG